MLLFTVKKMTSYFYQCSETIGNVTVSTLYVLVCHRHSWNIKNDDKPKGNFLLFSIKIIMKKKKKKKKKNCLTFLKNLLYFASFHVYFMCKDGKWSWQWFLSVLMLVKSRDQIFNLLGYSILLWRKIIKVSEKFSENSPKCCRISQMYSIE